MCQRICFEKAVHFYCKCTLFGSKLRRHFAGFIKKQRLQRMESRRLFCVPISLRIRKQWPIGTVFGFLGFFGISTCSLLLSSIHYGLRTYLNHCNSTSFKFENFFFFFLKPWPPKKLQHLRKAILQHVKYLIWWHWYFKTTFLDTYGLSVIGHKYYEFLQLIEACIRHWTSFIFSLIVFYM